MKKSLFFIPGLLITSDSSPNKGKCGVVNIYRARRTETNTKCIDSNGNLVKPDYILEKVEPLGTGTYHMKLIKTGDNIYRSDFNDLYIETQSCLETEKKMNAILVVNQTHSETIYTLNFGNTCN